jgi:hypothetical protein
MIDYYLEDRSRLAGQPKRTIADYVEQNGILVPKRFENLEEAWASGKDFIARTENQEDYDGISGLLRSPKFLLHLKYTSPSIYPKNTHELRKQEVDDRLSNTKALDHCKKLGVDLEDYARGLTFSFWELISGHDQVVVADSAIKNRHHVLTYGRAENDYYASWIITDGGKEREILSPIRKDGPKNSVSEIVELYEKIRRLPRFDPNHCPIMEFESREDQIYFLQYHRTRDFKESEFHLQREPREGEVQAELVRGATPPEGIEINLRIGQTRNEDYSYLTYPDGVKRARLTDRKLQLVDVSERFRFSYIKNFVNNHEDKARFFKPEVSVIVCTDNLLSTNEKEVKLRVVSDGRRALVQRLA